MNFVLKLFKLQNWRKPKPAEAARETTNHHIKIVWRQSIKVMLFISSRYERGKSVENVKEEETELHTNIAK